jgi:hypothetical protein
MKKIIAILAVLASPLQVLADSPPDAAKAYTVLACEPKAAADNLYNVDIVRDGTQLKLIIHIPLLGATSSEYFDVDAVNRRDPEKTTLRAATSGVTLVVAKQGRTNLNGEGTFASVFRGGAEYGIYAMICVKKEQPPTPPPVTTPAPTEPAPVDAKPVDAKPVDPAPVEPKPADPAVPSQPPIKIK